MKTYQLARESQVVTVLSLADAERMLATDYLRVMPRPKARGKDAKRMRSLRQHRLAAGWVHADLWIPPEVAAAILAVRLPRESYLALFIRLVNEHCSFLRKPEHPKDK